MILPPSPPTWQRWQTLATSPYSLLRSLQYERITGLELHGRILDLGGLRESSYYHLLKIDGTVESINIDHQVAPSVVADLNDALPFAEHSFDTAISLNTFEHLRNDELAIREMVRVLKPGGRLHIVVPFLYRIHASPYDYNRRTGYWWQDFLATLSLEPDTSHIEPLLWDPLSSAFSVVEYNFGRYRALPKRAIMLFALLNQWRLRRSQAKAESYIANSMEYALGYYVTAQKRAQNSAGASS